MFKLVPFSLGLDKTLPSGLCLSFLSKVKSKVVHLYSAFSM